MQALEPQLEDSPVEALPELADLIERMLGERGYDIDDAVARQGEEREIVAEFLAAREIADLVERGEPVSLGDVASAINGCRSLYEYLLDERAAP